MIDRHASCICQRTGCVWLRELHVLGANAVVLMAPSLNAPDELEPALHHPSTFKLSQTPLAANYPAVPRVLLIEQEQKNTLFPWARELLLLGYRSAVTTRFNLVGSRFCELWMFSTGVLSDATGAAMVWTSHCQWPALRAEMFRVRSNLTPRETDGLRELAKGKAQAEIAKSMGCSDRTVRFHLENAMTKLGASNSHAAVQRALLLGLE